MIEELAACSLHLVLSKVEKLRRGVKFKKKKSRKMFNNVLFLRQKVSQVLIGTGLAAPAVPPVSKSSMKMSLKLVPVEFITTVYL